MIAHERVHRLVAGGRLVDSSAVVPVKVIVNRVGGHQGAVGVQSVPYCIDGSRYAGPAVDSIPGLIADGVRTRVGARGAAVIVGVAPAGVFTQQTGGGDVLRRSGDVAAVAAARAAAREHDLLGQIVGACGILCLDRVIHRDLCRGLGDGRCCKSPAAAAVSLVLHTGHVIARCNTEQVVGADIPPVQGRRQKAGEGVTFRCCKGDRTGEPVLEQTEFSLFRVRQAFRNPFEVPIPDSFLHLPQVFGEGSHTTKGHHKAPYRKHDSESFRTHLFSPSRGCKRGYRHETVGCCGRRKKNASGHLSPEGAPSRCIRQPCCHGLSALDQWLCVTAFRRFCPFVPASNLRAAGCCLESLMNSIHHPGPERYSPVSNPEVDTNSFTAPSVSVCKS